jgi:hypothetical protein
VLLHIAIALLFIRRSHRNLVFTVLSQNITIVCVVLTLAGFIHAEMVNGYPVINPDVFSIYCVVPFNEMTFSHDCVALYAPQTQVNIRLRPPISVNKIHPVAASK